MVKQKYGEGDWFAVPLRNGGYALGVVARRDGRGGIIGYFFGQKYSAPPSLDEVTSKTATDAILVSILRATSTSKGPFCRAVQQRPQRSPKMELQDTAPWRLSSPNC